MPENRNRSHSPLKPLQGQLQLALLSCKMIVPLYSSYNDFLELHYILRCFLSLLPVEIV